MSMLHKAIQNRWCRQALAVAATLLYAIGVNWFIVPTGLYPGGLLGFLNALGVDRLGLCTVPCPVQALGKGGYALAIQLPCLAHDGGPIKLFHNALSFFG